MLPLANISSDPENAYFAARSGRRAEAEGLLLELISPGVGYVPLKFEHPPSNGFELKRPSFGACPEHPVPGKGGVNNQLPIEEIHAPPPVQYM